MQPSTMRGGWRPASPRNSVAGAPELGRGALLNAWITWQQRTACICAPCSRRLNVRFARDATAEVSLDQASSAAGLCVRSSPPSNLTREERPRAVFSRDSRPRSTMRLASFSPRKRKCVPSCGSTQASISPACASRTPYPGRAIQPGDGAARHCGARTTAPVAGVARAPGGRAGGCCVIAGSIEVLPVVKPTRRDLRPGQESLRARCSESHPSLTGPTSTSADAPPEDRRRTKAINAAATATAAPIHTTRIPRSYQARMTSAIWERCPPRLPSGRFNCRASPHKELSDGAGCLTLRAARNCNMAKASTTTATAMTSSRATGAS